VAATDAAVNGDGLVADTVDPRQGRMMAGRPQTAVALPEPMHVTGDVDAAGEPARDHGAAIAAHAAAALSHLTLPPPADAAAPVSATHASLARSFLSTSVTPPQ
jgi:hypothetical protein